MKLESVRIRHFKSLDDVAFDLDERVTLLVGPNAVGKSNVVDGLRFVRDAVAAGLEHAIASRGGIRRVRRYSKTKPFKVSIQLAFQQELENTNHDASYELAIQSQSASNYVVDLESMSSAQLNRREPGNVVRRKIARDQSGNANGFEDGRYVKVEQDQILLGAPRSAMLGLIRSSGSSKVGTFHPFIQAVCANPVLRTKDIGLAEGDTSRSNRCFPTL